METQEKNNAVGNYKYASKLSFYLAGLCAVGVMLILLVVLNVPSNQERGYINAQQKKLSENNAFVLVQGFKKEGTSVDVPEIRVIVPKDEYPLSKTGSLRISNTGYRNFYTRVKASGIVTWDQIMLGKIKNGRITGTGSVLSKRIPYYADFVSFTGETIQVQTYDRKPDKDQIYVLVRNELQDHTEVEFQKNKRPFVEKFESL